MIKVYFRRSKILIPVTEGSTGLFGIVCCLFLSALPVWQW